LRIISVREVLIRHKETFIRTTSKF